MSAILGIGTGLAGIASQAFGIGEKRQDERQIKQQQKLTDMQAKANEEAANRNQERMFEMWNKTNYGAQKKHLEDAGLNAALMYGMSGGGGATAAGAQEAGSTGGQASSGAANQQAQAAMGMQIAQIGLMTAQAEKTKAETEKIKGVDTELGKTTMEKISAESKLANIQAEVAGMSQTDAVRTIQFTAEKALAEAVQAQQKQVINEETMNDQIAKIKTDAIGAMIENEAKRANINLTESRIKEIATNIEQRWKAQDIDVENNKRMTEAMLWGAGIHAAGGIVNGIVNIAGKGAPSVVKHIK